MISAANSDIHVAVTVVIVFRTAITSITSWTLSHLLRYDVSLTRILLPLWCKLSLMSKNGVERQARHISQVPIYYSYKMPFTSWITSHITSGYKNHRELSSNQGNIYKYCNILVYYTKDLCSEIELRTLQLRDLSAQRKGFQCNDWSERYC